LFSQKEDREPERGQIERLVEGALGHRAVAEEARGHPRAPGQCVGQGEAHGDGQAGPDDGVTAIEAPPGVEDVHGAAASAAAAVGLAVHLGHEHAGGHPAHQRLAVFAVRGHDGVVRREGLHGPDRDGLLADVEMEKPPDLAQGVELGGLLLEAADQEHLAQEPVGVVRHVRLPPPSSSVEVSPSGNPSSRAFRSRRMIFPLRVLGASRETRSLGLRRRPGGAREGQQRAVRGRAMPSFRATKAHDLPAT
jgi:hypothetical protein